MSSLGHTQTCKLDFIKVFIITAVQ